MGKNMERETVCKAIRQLVCYGLKNGLIEKEDEIYTINQLLEILKLDEYALPQGAEESMSDETSLEEILGVLLSFACETRIIDDSITERDLFDTRLMNVLVPKPSQIIKKFQELYRESPKAATDFYYKLSQDSDYIRRYRIEKDQKWTVDTEYGELDITINLSKPEKDPKAIAAAKNAVQSGYPKCLLCKENEGYAGRLNHPARQNHRIIPVTINGQEWGFQYSPYVYYNEHCIVLNGEHIPMKIHKSAFGKLFDFVKAFPHYFVGSNADLPIVGGSILSHDHFQGGNYTFAMARANIEIPCVFKGFEEVEAGIVKWPMSVIRLRSKDEGQLIELADMILQKWRSYSDPEAVIFAETDGGPHNTITPIARKTEDTYELDLVLRNNLTTPEHPLGIYHPHSELHHIKKENIGLIEVMGLAVLPARLKEEMSLLAEYITEGKDIFSDDRIKKHGDWVREFSGKYELINKDNVDEILKNEIGLVFSRVLEHAGVYKRDAKGRESFMKFIKAAGGSHKILSLTKITD